jgi:hypothetical protein
VPPRAWRWRRGTHSSSTAGAVGGRRNIPRGKGRWWTAESPQPGLAPSCLVPLRLGDVAVLVWDMSDAWPPPAELPWGVHSAIFALGLSLVDNALLEELAQAGAESRTWEFFFSVTPLYLVGGTGSPVNPIAIL